MPPGMRMVACIVLLYLSFDFADPGMPGVFTFDADESVEVARIQKPDIPFDSIRPAEPQSKVGAVIVPTNAREQAVLVANAAISVESPTFALRPRIRYLSPEESPAASPAV
jgi:hypothetical protein